jgi:hypothetical protein
MITKAANSTSMALVMSEFLCLPLATMFRVQLYERDRELGPHVYFRLVHAYNTRWLNQSINCKVLSSGEHHATSPLVSKYFTRYKNFTSTYFTKYKNFTSTYFTKYKNFTLMTSNHYNNARPCNLSFSKESNLHEIKLSTLPTRQTYHNKVCT